MSAISREGALRTVLAPLLPDYDYVLMDCLPSLSLLVVNAFNAADGILIPWQADYLAMQGLAQVMETVAAVQSRLNSRLQIFGILLTMVDQRTSHSREVVATIRQAFAGQIRVFAAEIRLHVVLKDSTKAGLSIIEYDPQSAGAQAYMSLADEMIEMVDAMGAPEPAVPVGGASGGDCLANAAAATATWRGRGCYCAKRRRNRGRARGRQRRRPPGRRCSPEGDPYRAAALHRLHGRTRRVARKRRPVDPKLAERLFGERLKRLRPDRSAPANAALEALLGPARAEQPGGRAKAQAGAVNAPRRHVRRRPSVAGAPRRYSVYLSAQDITNADDVAARLRLVGGRRVSRSEVIRQAIRARGFPSTPTQQLIGGLNGDHPPAVQGGGTSTAPAIGPRQGRCAWRSSNRSRIISLRTASRGDRTGDGEPGNPAAPPAERHHRPAGPAGGGGKSCLRRISSRNRHRYRPLSACLSAHPSDARIREEIERLGGAIEETSLGKAVARLQAGDASGAIAELQTSNGDDQAATLTLARAQWAQGAIDQAVALAQQVLAVNAQSIAALMIIVAAETRRGRALRVREFQTRADAIDPGFNCTRSWQACCHCQSDASRGPRPAARQGSA